MKQPFYTNLVIKWGKEFVGNFFMKKAGPFAIVVLHGVFSTNCMEKWAERLRHFIAKLVLVPISI